jgi:broad specificity phosphatase PhoE
MSRLFLIRHAQASFFEADYDKLSCLGEQQARLLGAYWAERNVSFDRIYSGPRLRQKSTAEIVSQAFRAAGCACPELTVMQEFDEYPGDVVLRQTLPHLLESDRKIREWHREYQSAPDSPEKLKYFQRIFEAVIGKWVAGELSLGSVESWPEFCARVNRGLSQILSRAESGQQLAVFSSGGPVGVAMQRALNLSPQDTLRTVWMSRNSSYSEFLFSGDRFALSAFNAFPHLDSASMLTYR